MLEGSDFHSRRAAMLWNCTVARLARSWERKQDVGIPLLRMSPIDVSTSVTQASSSGMCLASKTNPQISSGQGRTDSLYKFRGSRACLRSYLEQEHSNDTHDAERGDRVCCLPGNRLGRSNPCLGAANSQSFRCGAWGGG